MKDFKRTAIAAGVAQVILLASGAVFAQTADTNADKDKDAKNTTTVVVTGQRAALESAANIKRNSDEIVDSIVAADIGKLPDRSVTEVLQRIPGVSIDRTQYRADPLQSTGDGIQRFAAEGTGVSVRGMNYVRSELNGRDSFSANGGRALSFEDVPPELMAGVDVYKNPSAEQIEGAIGGLVNLRTALPFDYKGFKAAISAEASRATRSEKTKPGLSGLVSNRWTTPLGQFGALIDVAHSEISTASDSMGVSPYIPRTDITPGQTRWISPGASWSSNIFNRTRDGLYGALQWKNENWSSAMTYFKSKYKMYTEESGFFMSTTPSTLTVDPGATYDAHGALLTGVLHNPTDGGFGLSNGIGFGTDARQSSRKADTSDLAWNVEWRATDQWAFRADLQHTRATTQAYDNTVGLGGFMPKETVDLRTSVPTYTFDASDRAWLANPNNYYWSFAQEHRDAAVATQNAAKFDAKFTFDSPVLQDLRFGFRMTDRDSVTNRTHGGSGGNEWQNITQSWSVGNSWQPYNHFAVLTDPRLSQTNYVAHSFGNFFNGTLPAAPTIIVPTQSTVTSSFNSVPAAYQELHNYANYYCANPPANGDCTNWKPSVFGGPSDTNLQKERTKAVFSQLRFGFDNLRYPIDGNIGVRVVRTEEKASGMLMFSPPTGTQPPGVPTIAAVNGMQTIEHNYTNVLPSLNMRMKASKELQFRFAVSKGMSRPDFYQMQQYTTLTMQPNSHVDPVTKQSVLDSIDFKGTANGNPMLKPVLSNNVDLTAEWYSSQGSSLTLSLFNKQIKDIIIQRTVVNTLTDSNGVGHDFLTNGPANGADGRAYGAELGFQHYFDNVPDWLKGIGVQGNYTYIRSHQNMHAPTALWCTPSGTLEANTLLNLSGCDTNGRVLGNEPMLGMSKNAVNFALLYDKGPWSSRLAYSWRSNYLQVINAFGTNNSDGLDQNPNSPNMGKPGSVAYALPVWGGAYGQVDFGLQYKVNEHFDVSFNVGNLTNAMFKQYMQQQIGLKEHFANFTGRSYYLKAHYNF
ncbi:TonB-dependent receptor [Massilia terrae]|uniref:TonB-dependent receptor n=1 Tax=Massilia terrae TaxID=1811224 RepID=A0ABT2CT55_9BURK|nr:TonB-dependent receptor [Massilia terrae]MCS0657166.1 TonB-dependent receptor [Massilia terrae]